tara:strand:- start:16 stop:561 length:546 start_codon:yes stop_codon:yes gene_type:complete
MVGVQPATAIAPTEDSVDAESKEPRFAGDNASDEEMKKRGYLQNGEEAFDKDSGEFRQAHADKNRKVQEKADADQTKMNAEMDAFEKEMLAARPTSGASDQTIPEGINNVDIMPTDKGTSADKTLMSAAADNAMPKAGESMDMQEKLLRATETQNMLLSQLVSKQTESNDLSEKIVQYSSV